MEFNFLKLGSKHFMTFNKNSPTPTDYNTIIITISLSIGLLLLCIGTSLWFLRKKSREKSRKTATKKHGGSASTISSGYCEMAEVNTISSQTRLANLIGKGRFGEVWRGEWCCKEQVRIWICRVI